MQRLIPWFVLKNLPGVGNHLFKRLITRFGSPEAVFEASTEMLATVQGISPKIISTIHHIRTPDSIVSEIELSMEKGFHIITFNDPGYPERLKEIPDPPPYLYVFGCIAPSRAMAVVGSRNATAYGLKSARRLAQDLSAIGVNIVSGMARGIDTAAHYGALDTGGITTAVLGSGLGSIYPPENKSLFHKIAERGAVISEFPVNAKPEPFNFPLRNRIICGMSLGVVVVEAAKKSGSLITAKLALEQGREVFAVPGSINSFKSAGVHGLLKEGATLVEGVRDILDAFPYIPDFQNRSVQNDSDDQENREPFLPESLTEPERKVARLLGPYPTHIDALSQQLNMAPGLVSGILLKLELMGIVSQAPGKYFTMNEESCGKTINHR